MSICPCWPVSMTMSMSMSMSMSVSMIIFIFISFYVHFHVHILSIIYTAESYCISKDPQNKSYSTMIYQFMQTHPAKSDSNVAKTLKLVLNSSRDGVSLK